MESGVESMVESKVESKVESTKNVGCGFRYYNQGNSETCCTLTYPQYLFAFAYRFQRS